ncbi:MAG: histidine phosphatase family protein [Myxococcota bacterium]|nr:histidine phosphatase family protein [Myxococcota bacterium]
MLPQVSSLVQWEHEPTREERVLLLVRHGQTAWNRQRRFLGSTDIPLDETGTTQARDLAEWLAPLPLTAVYTSPLSRALDTARALCSERNGLEPRVDPRLAELDQGVLEGQPSHVLSEDHPDFLEAWVTDPTHARIPGGETFGSCQERALAAIQQIADTHDPGPPVVIVSHRMVLAAILCHILEIPLRLHGRIGQVNTAINVITYADDRFSIRRLNESSHLRPRTSSGTSS